MSAPTPSWAKPPERVRGDPRLERGRGPGEATRRGVQRGRHHGAVGARPEQAPRRPSAPGAAAHQCAPLAGAQREPVDAGVVQRRAPDREDHRLGARQHLGPPVSDLAPRRVGPRQAAGLAPRRRHREERGVLLAGEDDVAVAAPAPAAPGLRQRHRRAAGERQPAQLALGEEGDRAAVGREEGRHGPARAGDAAAGGRAEGPIEEPLLVLGLVVGGVDDPAPVGRDRDAGRPRHQLAAVGRPEGEAGGTRRRRPLGRPREAAGEEAAGEEGERRGHGGAPQPAACRAALGRRSGLGRRDEREWRRHRVGGGRRRGRPPRLRRRGFGGAARLAARRGARRARRLARPRWLLRPQRGDEAVAAAVDRLDVERPLRLVPQRLPQEAHRLGQRGLGDVRPVPDPVEQGLLAHHPAGPVEQEGQHPQRPGRQGHLHAAARQDAVGAVEVEGAERDAGGGGGVDGDGCGFAGGHHGRSGRPGGSRGSKRRSAESYGFPPASLRTRPAPWPTLSPTGRGGPLESNGGAALWFPGTRFP